MFGVTIILNMKIMVIQNTTVEEYLNKITPCLKDIYVISTNLAHGKFI